VLLTVGARTAWKLEAKMIRLRTKLQTGTGTVIGLIPSKPIQKPAARKRVAPFNPKNFLAKVGNGKTTERAPIGHLIFSQGDAADAVFYIKTGRVKLTVVSEMGKEAVVAILGHGDFFGEGCLAGQLVCMATATALDPSMIMRIDKAAMIRVLHDESDFSELFMAHVLSRNVRIQADLVDHLFNSAEKRLARILLLMAHYGKEGKPEPIIPKISQDMLADMIGTTRSRVSLFLNKFRKLGFIHYNGRMEVHSSLLNIVLHD
jgi:CRP/FNR family transcriptional regulator, cyclic AMP receptor protein